MNKLYQAARSFIYRNARPLDFARFRFHFEGGSREDVLNILAAYQNADGGFGHALEPDFWNPASTPIATWAATCILREIGLCDAKDPVIAGILRYLSSGSDFESGQWYTAVASNNDHPHAVWWACSSDKGTPHDNPTMSLAGFALRFASPDSPLYSKAQEIAARAIAAFVNAPISDDAHTTSCYAELLGYLEAASPLPSVDLPAFRKAVHAAVNEAICKEPAKWFTEYVCKPSQFFGKLPGFFSVISPDLCREEAALLAQKQEESGAWPVTWQWHTPYKEYHISANWWRASLTLDNLLYMQAMNLLEHDA